MIEAGIHLVHKTVGQSSFDVIRGFKRRAFEAGQKKLALGHGGLLRRLGHRDACDPRDRQRPGRVVRRRPAGPPPAMTARACRAARIESGLAL